MSEAMTLTPASHDTDVTPGELLKRAREEAALTLQEVADELRLDLWMLEAIEANRFQALGAPVYARGYLRTYATHLGVPVDEVLRRYEALEDLPQEPEPIPAAMATTLRERRRSLRGPLLAMLALVVVAGLVYLALDVFLFASKTEDANAGTAGGAVEHNASNETQLPLVQPVSAVASVNDSHDAHTTEVDALLAQATDANVPSSEMTGASPMTSSGPAPVEARLEFTGESWVEIYDATGARLLFGMGTPARARTVSGTPPLQVILGAASAVRLQVNGQPVVIPRREGREATRFTIEADGTLR